MDSLHEDLNKVGTILTLLKYTIILDYSIWSVHYKKISNRRNVTAILEFGIFISEINLGMNSEMILMCDKYVILGALN